MPTEPTITIQGCSYLVTDSHGKVNTVGKDKSCSCGRKACWHVNQVKRYLSSGGEKAPDAQPLNTDHIEAIFTGNNQWTSQDATPTPYQNPYSLAYWAQRAVKIKASQKKMEQDGDGQCLSAVGQYWHDMTRLTFSEMCAKWKLSVKELTLAEQLRLEM